MTDFLDVDRDLLERFEAGLNPQRPDRSSIPARLIGYGEISAIFQLEDRPVAYKRLPLFDTTAGAEEYAALYLEYCGLLEKAGLTLPPTGTAVVAAPGRPVTLYITQKLIPAEKFGHLLIHRLEDADIPELFRCILDEADKIRACNETIGPDLEIAVDGQLSNWAALDDGRFCYLDTSTPFIKRSGVHQLNPKLILKAVPGPLRGIVERLFADEVLDRYYDPRLNMIDMIANLYKEQRPDLIPVALEEANLHLPDGTESITVKDVDSYYRQDRFIWSLFLALRRLDRWVATKVRRGRYEFILPGPIKR